MFELDFDVVEGEDIVKASKGLARTSLAQITINRNDENSESETEDVRPKKKQKKGSSNSKKPKIKTIPGISKLYCWEWPTKGPLAGFIRVRGLPHAGPWESFSLADIAKLSNAPIIRPNLIVSAHTEPISDWTMPIPMTQGT